MSAWGNTDEDPVKAWSMNSPPTDLMPVKEASLDATGAEVGGVLDSAPPRVTPQEAGWVEKSQFDYETYNKTPKELRESGNQAEWASNAVKYEWNDDFGDVGPEFKELEEQLFGKEFRMTKGIQFEKIKAIEVVQEGTVKINPVRSFDDAGLHPIMLQNVKLAGYDVPTPIQAYCLPAILKGYDVVACAQTGSGKTAAFLIPTLSKLMGKAKKLAAPRPNPATFIEGADPRVRAEPLILIVCPSRELAVQIFDEARRFCYRSMLRPCVLYGGGPRDEQIKQLQKGCDVLIATPGRLCDIIERPDVLSLKRLKYTIIDEADEMLQSDWDTELGKVMAGGDQEIGNITYMMFSATFPKSARDLAKEHLAHDHVRIRVGRAGSTHHNIKQNVVFVDSSLKRTALLDLIYANPPARTIVFVNSKRTCDEVDDYLFNLDLPCTSIHGDRTQREREDALRAFRTGRCPILVATGVSARGLDIHNVMHVINYDLPALQHGGIEEYTHRIGRTGRIGNEGLATSFYNDRDSDLGTVLTNTLLETGQEVPDFLQQYVPETGAALHFDADSDNETEAVAVSGDAGGGWGQSPGAVVASEWDATGTVAQPVVAGLDTLSLHSTATTVAVPTVILANIPTAVSNSAPSKLPTTSWGPVATVTGIENSAPKAVPPMPAPANPWGAPAPVTPAPTAPVADSWNVSAGASGNW